MIRWLVRIRAALSRLLSVLIVLVLVVMTLGVLWGVVTRYAIGGQSPWTEELARLMLVWVTMLGGALAYGERAHLGVDLVTGRLAPEARRVAGVVVELCCIFFAAYVMVWGGGQLTLARYESGQTLSALGISRAWVYLSVPVGGVLIVVYGLEELILRLFGQGDDRVVSEPTSPVGELVED